jgi:hypothetical protein
MAENGLRNNNDHNNNNIHRLVSLRKSFNIVGITENYRQI